MKALAVLALGLIALASPVAAMSSNSLTSLVTLRVEVAGEISEIEVPLGEQATVGLIADESRYLVLTPTVAPGSKGIHLAVEAVQEVAGIPHRHPVTTGTLGKNRSLAMVGAGLRLEVEYAKLTKLSLEATLRPIRCCVTCDGVTSCGHCVSTSCGSCCIRN
ncbi:MAG: hypothetical protein AAF604_09260 [Acidobacteriota bacterium]